MQPIRQKIIITGNPAEGFEFTGPFGVFEGYRLDDATASIDGDWWVAELIAPDEVGS